MSAILKRVAIEITADKYSVRVYDCNDKLLSERVWEMYDGGATCTNQGDIFDDIPSGDTEALEEIDGISLDLFGIARALDTQMFFADDESTEEIHGADPAENDDSDTCNR